MIRRHTRLHVEILRRPAFCISKAWKRLETGLKFENWHHEEGIGSPGVYICNIINNLKMTRVSNTHNHGLHLYSEM